MQLITYSVSTSVSSTLSDDLCRGPGISFSSSTSDNFSAKDSSRDTVTLGAAGRDLSGKKQFQLTWV